MSISWGSPKKEQFDSELKSHQVLAAKLFQKSLAAYGEATTGGIDSVVEEYFVDQMNRNFKTTRADAERAFAELKAKRAASRERELRAARPWDAKRSKTKLALLVLENTPPPPKSEDHPDIDIWTKRETTTALINTFEHLYETNKKYYDILVQFWNVCEDILTDKEHVSLSKYQDLQGIDLDWNAVTTVVKGTGTTTYRFLPEAIRILQEHPDPTSLTNTDVLVLFSCIMSFINVEA